MDIYNQFLSSDEAHELEYRIPIDKSQYDAVLNHMKGKTGWKDNGLSMSLTIIMGKNIRMTLNGSKLIEYFCARDFIASEDWSNVMIGNKRVIATDPVKPRSGEGRTTLSIEDEIDFASLVLNSDTLSEMSDEVKAIVQESQLSGKNKIDLKVFKKFFRLRSRVSFTLGDLIRVDLTKVKENDKQYGLSGEIRPKTVLTMKDAMLGKQPLKYEMEIEVLRKHADAISAMQKAIPDLKEVIGVKDVELPRFVQELYKKCLRALITSHYQYLSSQDGGVPEGSPATLAEAIQTYTNKKRSPYIIPKLVSMTKSDVPIADNMAVTDKADGDSCIVLVAARKMAVFDSGFRLLAPIRDLDESYEHTTMDVFAGEFLQKDRSGLPHSTAYLYDCYMWQGQDTRRLPLVKEEEGETRIGFVQKFVEMVKGSEPVIGSGLRVRGKEMLVGSPKELSEMIWKRRQSYPYVLDGIILTPSIAPVGMSEENPWEWGYRMNRTWHTNFKWKPPEFNSVDFLLTWTSPITKGANGLIRKGELRTTERVEKHGVEATVFPLFQPTEYVKPRVYQVEVPVNAAKEPITEEDNEYVRNRSIVECRYDLEKEQWIVLRNRRDKTVAWDRTMEILKEQTSKLVTLIQKANQRGRTHQWERLVMQDIRVRGSVRVQEMKQNEMNLLKVLLERFLRFHGYMETESDIVTVCKHQKEELLKLLQNPFVEIPLTFGLSGSNSTFVANTIWKSIHEPVHISDFDRRLEIELEEPAASGAGEDRTTSGVYPHTALSLPIDDKVNRGIATMLHDQIKEGETVLEMSDREIPLVKDAMLWTSKVDIRKTPSIIRGDARKAKTGWLNKDDKTTWQNWVKETGGATHTLVVGLPGVLENAKQRKGLVDNLTKSAKSGTKLYIVYWDHSKIAAAFKKIETWTEYENGMAAKKRRGGHVSIRDAEGVVYDLTSWPEDKFLTEYTSSGWKVVENEAVLSGFNAIAKKSPVTSFLSLMVLEH